MLALQFRIHREFSDVSGFVVSLFNKCEKGFVFQHPPDEEVQRVHIHGYLFEPTVTRKTLSEQIAKKLNLKGNTDFGTGDTCGKKKLPLDVSGAYCYGSKWDTIAPNFSKNISPVELEELRCYSRKMGTYNNIASSTHTKEVVVIKEVKVKTKPTQYQHLTNVVNRIMDQYPDLFKFSPLELRTKVFEVTYNYFRENELFMGRYKQLDFLDMVLLKLNCTEYKNLLFTDFTRRTISHS